MPEPEHSRVDDGVAFERILERALNSGQVSEALDRSDGRLDREQLRTSALQAQADIAAAAAVEHQDYLGATAEATAQDGGQGVASAKGEAARCGGESPPGPALLVPGLSAVAAALFLLLGFSLRALDGRPYVGDGLLTVGLLAGAIAAGSVVGDLGWLLVTAARNRSRANDGPPGHGVLEAGRAREAWELALLERGMVPFLLGRIEESRGLGRGGRPTC